MDDVIVSSDPPALRSKRRASRPEPFIVQPLSTHTHTLVLLHGLGNNGEKFGTRFLESVTSNGTRLSHLLPGTKFIFPTAKKRRSTAFNRATFNQWFDIASLKDKSYREDVQLEGLAESAEYVGSILRQEATEICSENIALGGMSQGSAMALMLLLSLDFQLGGLIGLSCWLPFGKDIAESIAERGDDEQEDGVVFASDEPDESEKRDQPTPAVAFVRDLLSIGSIPRACAASGTSRTCLQTPIFLGHGQQDERVNVSLGKQAAETLRAIGMNVTFESYQDLGHDYQLTDEIEDILSFLCTNGWIRDGRVSFN